MSYEYLDTHPDAAALPATCDYGRYLLGAIVHEGRIYCGWGNWHKTACEGLKAVRAFSLFSNLFETTPEFEASTESIYDYRIGPDGGLYVPHIDPHSAGPGVFTGIAYSKKVGGVWFSSEVLDLWHVFDIQFMNGNTYLIGSTGNPGQGMVLESVDGETTFQVSLTQPVSGQTTRFFFSFVWGNELYVQADKAAACKIYDGTSSPSGAPGAWRDGPDLLPNGQQGFFANHFAGKVVYCGKDRGMAGRLYAFDGTAAQSVKNNVIKYCVHNGTLYASFADGSIKQTTNLTSWQTLPAFADGPVTCLVGYEDWLYLGTNQSRVYRIGV